MRFTLFGLLFIAFPLFAQDTISLRNDREGESFYASKRTNKAIQRAIQVIPGDSILDSFQDILSNTTERELCSFDLAEKLQGQFEHHAPGFEEFPGAVHYLRSMDEIDDTVVKLLLTAHETLTKNLRLPKYEEELVLPKDEAKVKELIQAIGSINGKLKTTCFDEAYRSLHNELNKIQKGLSSSHLEALLVRAYQAKLIDLTLYKKLEGARQTDLQKSTMTLLTYYKKIKSLRHQYPLRDPSERNDFVAEKVKKQKFSRRQHLLENYSDLQIILMGNVVKKLKSRLESNRVEILVYDNEDDLMETIPLEPMERFRFAIKVLRKEMAMLSLNTYFAGRSPGYLDLMTAAYEVGIVPGVEVEEIAGLEELWNPKKTFWDKAGTWIRTFANMSTLVIPPPYGFVPALALVVIEGTVGKKDQKTDDNTSLF